MGRHELRVMSFTVWPIVWSLRAQLHLLPQASMPIMAGAEVSEARQQLLALDLLFQHHPVIPVRVMHLDSYLCQVELHDRKFHASPTPGLDEAATASLWHFEMPPRKEVDVPSI